MAAKKPTTKAKATAARPVGRPPAQKMVTRKTAFSQTKVARINGPDQRPTAKRKPAQIDIPKFASEVSRNYARGVARVGKEVDVASKWVGNGAEGARRFIAGGGASGAVTGNRKSTRAGRT